MNAKLQFTGLSAMFKVLFPMEEEIILTENELVGLINTVFRLSNTIKWYNEYLNYEQKESFFKTIIFSILLALVIILFIVAIYLFVTSAKKSSTEDTVPLRNGNQQIS